MRTKRCVQVHKLRIFLIRINGRVTCALYLLIYSRTVVLWSVQPPARSFVRYSIHLSTFPSVLPFVRPFVHSSIHKSFRSSLCPPIRPSIYPSIRPFFSPSFRPPFHPFVLPSVHPLVHSSIRRPVHLSIRSCVLSYMEWYTQGRSTSTFWISFSLNPKTKHSRVQLKQGNRTQ